MGKRVPNSEKNQFKPGESGNPNGRPPKLLSHITQELKQEGFEPVTNAQVLEAYGMLINLDEARIKAIITNSAHPMFLRIVAKAMLGNKGTEMIEKMLERAYGKALQAVDHTSRGNEIGASFLDFLKESAKK